MSPASYRAAPPRVACSTLRVGDPRIKSGVPAPLLLAGLLVRNGLLGVLDLLAHLVDLRLVRRQVAVLERLLRVVVERLRVVEQRRGSLLPRTLVVGGRRRATVVGRRALLQ